MKKKFEKITLDFYFKKKLRKKDKKEFVNFIVEMLDQYDTNNYNLINIKWEDNKYAI